MNCDDHQNSAGGFGNIDIIKQRQPGIHPIDGTYMWICSDCGAFLLPDGFSFRAITKDEYQDWLKALNEAWAARHPPPPSKTRCPAPPDNPPPPKAAWHAPVSDPHAR